MAAIDRQRWDLVLLDLMRSGAWATASKAPRQDRAAPMLVRRAHHRAADAVAVAFTALVAALFAALVAAALAMLGRDLAHKRKQKALQRVPHGLARHIVGQCPEITLADRAARAAFPAWPRPATRSQRSSRPSTT